MPNEITVEGKVLGQRRPVFSDWSVPLPPNIESTGTPLTLRALIACVVRAEVVSFHERQTEQRLQHFLGKDEIALGLKQGKVAPDAGDIHPNIELAIAVETAILGFIDGLYFVFLDDIQQEDLDATVQLKAESHLTFIKLVALAGG